MFFIRKNPTEKKLIELGYDWIVKNYRRQLRNNQLSKAEWRKALDNFYQSVAHKKEGKNNVNVAVRQTFDDNEVLPALNVSQITLPEYDIDFLKNKIYHDYKTTGKPTLSDIDFLYQIFKKEFPENITQPDCPVNDTDQAIDIITEEYNKEKAALINAAFEFLSH
ncbi:hypothetical protein [Avrilella dinanensis]|uniref:hypothetical protein n=1 Tax=Avrilella dinanensis TaxID=2008672 RepID=UPI00240930E1|nr:hypothetical protein [Avrilella dinanensis]